MGNTLNLGILAHVDAGKTSLTERLLHAVGAITELGSVNNGSTLTDSLALERQRGITIRSAVASFMVGGITVNLIDTPGHPDFIAEVERVLNVLDGAIVVVSAVEGVQAQTRILMRTLRRLRIPTLIFVNKIDRAGARYDDVLSDIAKKLFPSIVAMGTVSELGTRYAQYLPYDHADPQFTAQLIEVLADHNDALLAAYVNNEIGASHQHLLDELARQNEQMLAYPVFFGSAITGAGVDSLITGLTKFLPSAKGDPDGPVSGTVFKIERGPAAEKIAYVRLFTGTIRTRDRLLYGRGQENKVTAISVFDRGSSTPRALLRAGEIGRLWGLANVRIGDSIGLPQATRAVDHHFASPTLATVVVPKRISEKGKLHTALVQLAEQDPLINLRQDDIRQEFTVSLYGEVQKEIIEATLADDYGVEVEFRETAPICIERPIGTGEGEEILNAPENPFLATMRIRVEPAPEGSGLEFRLDVEHQAVPLYIYKNVRNFSIAMEQFVRQTLREGLYGWQVTDCVVSLVRSQYSVLDGPPSLRGPLSSPQDFRNVTPLVVMAALKESGTVVCEPIHRFRLDTMVDTLTAVLPVLVKLHAVPEVSATNDLWCTLEGNIPAARVHELRQQIPPLTRGEGILESSFHHYEPVRGPAPVRSRTDDNPLNRDEYIQRVTRRVLGEKREQRQPVE